mmetsp:Transcript_626/g.967  ORF Transcript_626/g.967 Transcript_626/m.967 type:complete len:290 (-) Transcript_626:2058-2927(-)
MSRFTFTFTITVTRIGILCLQLCFFLHHPATLLTDAFTIATLPIATATTGTRTPSFTGYHNVKINGNSIDTTFQRSLPAALYMVATKSGGRAILSELQFQIEVLHQSETDNDDSDGDGDGDGDSTNNSNSNNEQQSKTSSTTTTDFKPCSTPTLVFFSAPWCGPCRLSNPVVKDIIKAFVPKIDVVEVCTDDLPDIAEQAGVTSIPTIQIYHQGDILDTIVGCVSKNVLGNAVDKVLEDLGLDLEDDDDDDESDDKRFQKLSDHEKRKEYKRARKVVETIKDSASGIEA